MSVWFVKPTIGMSGYASATSSGSMRDDVGDHELRLFDGVRCHELCPGNSTSSLPRKKRSTPVSRIVATRAM